MTHAPQHVWFICRECRRLITGCREECPAEHLVEEVDSCAVCASKRKEAEER